MSNTFTKPSNLIAGTTARAADINLRVDSTETGFDNVEAITNRSVKLPVGTSGDQVLSESAPNRALKEIGFDANGDLVLIGSAFQWKGDWATSTAYGKNDVVRDSSTKNIYAVTVDHTSGVLATDISAAKLSLAINVVDVETAKAAAQTAQAAAETAETNAETAETNAETAETNATAQAVTSTAQAVIATAKASEALASASAGAASATTAASSATAATSSATAGATSATNAANSATASASSASTATTQAGLATTNGEAQVSLAATQAGLATTNGAAQVTLATTQANDSATSATASAGSASTSTTKASEASTSATAAASSATGAASSATNAATITALTMGAGSSNPTTGTGGGALVTGALFFNTTDNAMNVYNGSGWVGASSSVNGTAERTVYTATASQTTFAATYDVGFVDVYLNGIKLQVTADFSDSSGTNIVLTVGATVGDIVDIIAYGTFNVANTYTPATADAKFAQVANNLSDVASAATTRTNLGLAIGTDVEAFDANKYPAPTVTGTSTTATNASFHIASAGGITITLPASPTAGNYVIIKDGTGAAETTTFTVARNGSNIASSATDLTFDKNFAEVVMTYVNATIGWSV